MRFRRGVQVVQNRGGAGGIEDGRVVDEEVGSLGEVDEVVVLRGEIARHDEDVSRVLEAEREGRGVAVVDGHRRHVQVVVPEDLLDGGVLCGRQIDGVELQCVPELRQIGKGALRSEQAGDEGGRARVVAAAARSEEPEEERLVEAEVARHDDTGNIAAVIDVEVRDEEGVEPAQVDAHLAESHERARPDVDQSARDAVEKDHVARGRATEAGRAPRAEDGELEGRGRRRASRAGVRARGGGGGKGRLRVRAAERNGGHGGEKSESHAAVYHWFRRAPRTSGSERRARRATRSGRRHETGDRGQRA
ncbi:MAG TPA: hypothetical protein VGL81_31550 [Polyangiaceae bacterium]|jgi:hypothetical protein